MNKNMTILRTSIIGISHFKLDFEKIFPFLFPGHSYLSHATKHDGIGWPQRRSSPRFVSGKDFITAQPPSTVNPCFNSVFGRLFLSLPWWLNLICCVGVMQYLLALFSWPICHLPFPPPQLQSGRYYSSQDNWDLSQSACIWPCGGEIRVGFIYLWETVRRISSQEAWETLQCCRSLDALSAFTQKPCGKRY